MGSKPQDGDHEAQQAAHLQMLSSVIPRQEFLLNIDNQIVMLTWKPSTCNLLFNFYVGHNSEEKERVSLMQSYHRAFTGFSAMLTGKEAALLSGWCFHLPAQLNRLLIISSFTNFNSLDQMQVNNLSLDCYLSILIECFGCFTSGFDEVVSVFPDRILQLHTTRSWDFLDTESGIGSQRLRRKASSDVIIGIIDTGDFLYFYLRQHSTPAVTGETRS